MDTRGVCVHVVSFPDSAQGEREREREREREEIRGHEERVYVCRGRER